MIKNSILAIAILALTVSCKKEDALSKVDPNSTDIQATGYIDAAQAPALTTAPSVETVNTVPANGKYAVMTFTKKEHDFGGINEGDKVETTFTFKNTGEADLIISNAAGSCGCTVPEYPKTPIKPGKSASMKVSFDSTGKPGMQQKSITITANTATGTDVLTIKANVTPKAK